MTNETQNNELALPNKVEQPSPIVIKSNQAKSYPGFSTFMGIGVLGVIGYFILNRETKKGADKKQEKKEKEYSNDLMAETLKDTNGTSYNPKELAAKYKQAIYGGGTSEQSLMELARRSKSGRWPAISKAYEKLTKSALNNDLQAEFSTGEYNLFMNILKSKYWFAKGEYVYPRKSTLIVYEKNKFKLESFQWKYSIGQGIGIIKQAKRVKYKGKTVVVYLTNAYSGKWILSQHLKTQY